ncbi:MAG: hypothetical protein UV61_C0008G0086 [Candidatus Gottesmanbacteria bacterium GW2011_GWB1_43_11]|uniref:Uncharacterized protein n=1 Tax=Candidatus Gottesmanbacteria bacterium GW2011_GWB1_43_11 TaxID=1618446 RepID=A0A0G1FIH4_9BACT|nr:MAG: hypothetical protein UV04_C0009G0081 [Candidatus Gottesmanbacteria bacterium GW2011_GWA2_42_16]KKS54928.1 MAG: hypothetical protein UV17_C0014G0011 [Candidatus Gottesmanbacteria bacterium GW2011_GWA1_42_26]KKS82118.1 MAG: hypothetical protein UV55_C0005G0036 [Candidatus Gottesmanbacteria bacterium GW2011_GWC1_43_10]KKS86633.1 MAG: hypothetical protein UV61_C0008G0086 [Candidatus Gottesmanbacteria bacterium GW2011_GWB1_43_11]
MDSKTQALFDAKVAIIKRDLANEIRKVEDKYDTLDERDLR